MGRTRIDRMPHVIALPPVQRDPRPRADLDGRRVEAVRDLQPHQRDVDASDPLPAALGPAQPELERPQELGPARRVPALGHRRAEDVDPEPPPGPAQFGVHGRQLRLAQATAPDSHSQWAIPTDEALEQEEYDRWEDYGEQQARSSHMEA